MRNNRHMEFLKSIQLLGEEKEDRNTKREADNCRTE